MIRGRLARYCLLQTTQ